MGLFGNKKPRVVDWTEKLNNQQERANRMREDLASQSSHNSTSTQEDSVSPFPFFAGNTSENSTSSENSTYNPYSSRSNSGYNSASEDSAEEKRKRLGKRLLDMTNKIEELSNQVYQLQQRIEVLERRHERSY